MQRFAAGGPVLKDGPIYAHAGEFVIPNGGNSGGTQVIQLVVDGKVLSEIVTNHNVRRLKSNTKLGT
jgi:hypothetical protein